MLGVKRIWRDTKIRAVGKAQTKTIVETAEHRGGNKEGMEIRTVSGFLEEVGDISRFNNPKEL